MKDKVISILKVYVLLLAMILGFYLVYMFVWYIIDLPITTWASLLLMALAVLTEYGYYRWVRED